MVPNNAFLLVLDLHGLEHVLGELLLKLLVGVVNAELLERVVLEVLETEDIKHTHVVGHVRVVRERLVNRGHEPVEHIGVDSLGKSVTAVHGQLLLKRHAVDIVHSAHGTRTQSRLKGLPGNAKHLSSRVSASVAFNDQRLLIVRRVGL